MSNLAAAYQVAGRIAEAVAMFEEVLARGRRSWAQTTPRRSRAMSNLALAYREAGRTDAAIPMFEDVLRLRKSKLGSDHPDTLKTMNDLAAAYLEMKRWGDAEALLRVPGAPREATAGRLAPLPDDEPARCRPGGPEIYADAEPLLAEGYEGMVLRKSQISAHRKKDLTAAGSRIVPFYESWGKSEKAASWRQKLAQSTTTHRPEP